MKNGRVYCLFVVVSLMIVLSFGCSKEKIVESTQYIHDTKYVDLPPDTVWRIDTVVQYDSSTVIHTDTVQVRDTVRVTTIVHDTVETVTHHYDTVVRPSFVPSAATAISAMEVQTDPLIFDFAEENFGDASGWTFYLSPVQMNGTQVSTGVYDIGAYAMYWTADFSGYYPLEIYWRMTYKSGDPSDAANWTMTDPPAAAPGRTPGVSASLKTLSAMHLSQDKLIPVQQK